MTTYKELLAVRDDNRWPSAQPSLRPDPMVVDYTERHGRREGLLYNNRIMSGLKSYAAQYNVNRDWILANF